MPSHNPAPFMGGRRRSGWDTIHRTANGYLTKPVVDMTELKGAFDFAISWSPRGATQNQPNRLGNVRRRKRSRCDLVKQRLE